jgi:hypothetical protein
MPYMCHIICGTMYVYMCVCVRAFFWQGNAIKFQKSSWGTFHASLLCVQSLCKSYLMFPAVYRYACCYCLRKCENIKET